MCEKSGKKPGEEHIEKLSDESFITKKCFLKLTKDSDCVRDIPAHVPCTTKYPKANLYYAFAEDTHPTKRIVTASKFFKEQKFVSHSASYKERFQDYNLEDEAVNHYLGTEPLSFVIFGKPGLLHGNLASAIADSWKCVLISPEMLIRQEIDEGTEKGQYMENILRSGESIGNEITMDLIRCRIRKRDVKHRGYVVECLPFIPDMNSEDSSYSSTIRNMVYRTCSEFCENTAGKNYEAYEDLIISNNVGYKTQYEYEQEIARQIDEMFTVWPRKPLIIIYLVCPKQDVASRCARWRIDRTSRGYNIFDENEYTHPFDGEYERDESDTSYDFSQDANERSVNDVERMSHILFDKYKLRCDLYERLALPVIDKWILAHDPQHVIRVDGRSSTRRILQILKTRLCTLALQPSILPKKIIVQDDIHFLETSTKMNLNDELEQKSTEEIFEILKQREVVSPKYFWKLSVWKFYCPVALAQGRTIKGHSKHAVRFLSKIFFLSSQEAVNLFIENPRTFLLPPNPRPTCKIAVFGPKYTGKSELSARLAEVFGGIVINVDEILKKLIKQREESLNQKLYEKDLNVQISLEPIDRSIDEKADIIIQNIKEISDMKLEDELRRDGGYVVDGMCVDDQIWRKIVDDANIVFEDIIVLFEKEPYAYLLNKFRDFFYFDNLVHKADYGGGDTEADQKEYTMLHKDAEWEYLVHLTRFESEWTKFEKQILEFRGNVIRCNLADIQDVTEYVINHIKSRYFDTSVSVQGKDQENEIQQEKATAAEIKTSLATKNDNKIENEYLSYSVDLETAEQLLNCGYFFFSTFGRWCPVQVYTNKIPIQMFLPMKDRGQIFPVVIHPYIYFLAGKTALFAFVNDASRYLTVVCRPSLIPLRISIIGPPQCGKTTLANRFAETYGMKIINCVTALRHMLKYYSWTESARRAEEDELRAGQLASIESIMRAIEMLSIGPRAATQGYILDGCPSSREEAEQLTLLGMQPMIVLDLKADLEFCIECLSRDNDDPTKPLKFPINFLSDWYADWQKDQATFRNWLKKFSQNVIELDATKSKWHVWTRADYAVQSRFADIILYFNEADLKKAHSLKHMCVSPYEFRSRQSRYASYCPVCFLEKILITSGQSVDSQGMIQFREYFYWICPQHMNTFIKNPLQYVSSVNATSLLDERPRILKEIVDTEHACWAQRLQVRGFCLVTYVDGLPDRKLTKGKVDLGVIFKNKLYLFCNENCREKFLAQHNKYSEVDVSFPREIPLIKMRHLSNVDFLEQTVARMLVEAVNIIAIRRPKIFGLSAAVSAAIYIGVYMKTHNTSENLHEMDIYEAVNKRIEGLHKIIEIVTNAMKKKINPYVSLPKYPS
ncbi:adenylate kinase 9 isoform X1 [Polyergus mexicanus]|uniref:adenylate kinase 9 isoform X1 n=1 Tax=Polyergus mexicanus TaxID=615972 RepID=UPI0038B666B9